MRYLQTFNESQGPDYDKISSILSKLGIKKFTINPDGVVDVDGDVTIYKHTLGLVTRGKLVELPITFGTINGDFIYTKYSLSETNTSLKSLKGFPRIIHRMFHIFDEDSPITSLEGGPEFVGGQVSLNSLKKLKSLKGAPTHIGRDFNSRNCPITSLEGLPNSLEGFLQVHGSNLTDLKGSPRDIGGAFYISNAPLTSLEGIPNSTKYNIDLTTSDALLWDPTPLKNLRDCSSLNFYRKCPITDLINFFHAMSEGENRFQSDNKSKYFWVLCNGNPSWENFMGSLDYNYIRGSAKDPQINLFRFMEALSELEWDPIPYLKTKRNGTKGIGRYKFVDNDGNKVTITGGKY